MPDPNLTESTVPERFGKRAGSSTPGPDPWSLGLLPAALVGGLLLVATAWDGGFDLRHWAPPTLFTLVVLIVLQATGASVRTQGAIRAAVVAIWALAGWSLLSLLWSDSASRGWEGGSRMVLYAAIVSIGLTALRGRKEARLVGYGLVAGAAAISVVTLIALHFDGKEMFLAGRLDAPVNYRNASAVLFAFSFWPLIVIAAGRAYNPAVRGLAFSTAVLSLGLAFLTQSRSVALGLAVGAVVALGLGPDRVRRAWVALLALGGIAAISGTLLTPYDAFDVGRGLVGAGDIATAVNALTVLVVAALLVGFLVALFDGGLRRTSPSMRHLRQAARVALAVVAVVALVGGIAAMGNPVSFGKDKLDEFRSLENPTGATRLTGTGGQRYDLWRIAWNDFEESPLIGAGMGAYPRSYYQERATDRNVDNPHSLGVQLLGETGLVGAGLFVAFLAALAVAISNGWRAAPDEFRRAGVGFAAAGAVVIGQALIDWVWLIPGVMGLGLLALALAVASLSERSPGAERSAGRAPWLRWVWAGALGLATLSVLLLFLADFQVRRARAEADRSSETQLSAARTAAALNPFSPVPKYLQASALETRGRREDARKQLLEALDREPESFVTLGLLGDLEVRAGHREAARDYYRRALRLNPRDVGLQQLVKNPPVVRPRRR